MILQSMKFGRLTNIIVLEELLLYNFVLFNDYLMMLGFFFSSYVYSFVNIMGQRQDIGHVHESTDIVVKPINVY